MSKITLELNELDKLKKESDNVAFSMKNLPRPYAIVMKLEDFIKIPDNDIQRAIENAHGEKAAKNHLKLAHPAQYVASVAKIRSTGELVKLDGHTKSYLWSVGRLEKLYEDIIINIFEVDTKEQTYNLYYTFDNKFAMEGVSDTITGAFKKLGFKPNTHEIKTGSIVSAFKKAMNVVYKIPSNDKTPIIYKIPYFLEELKDIDSRRWVIRNKIKAGTLAAILILRKKYGRKVLDFFEEVVNVPRKPCKKDIYGNYYTDAGGILQDWINEANGDSDKNKNPFNGGNAVDCYCSYALSAYEGYLNKKVYFNLIELTQADLKEYNIENIEYYKQQNN